jgi:hypothetical protein
MADCTCIVLSSMSCSTTRISPLILCFDSVTLRLATFGLASIVQSFPTEQL